MRSIHPRQSGPGCKPGRRGLRLAPVLLGLVAACAPGSQPESRPDAGTSVDTTPAQEGEAPDSAPVSQSAADGLAVYASQYCGVCHELGSAESVGTSGPTHDAIGTIAAQRIADSRYTGEATTAEAYMRESIVAPMAYIVPGYEVTLYRMPAYTNLSEPELEALVQMLLKEK
ncbi:MAG: hypothetical protein ABFS14_13165 [Gemmatimonadota bacterium]